MTTQPTKIRVSMAFRRMSDSALLARSIAVQTGMTGNINFPTPPLDLGTLKVANENFSAAISASLDGGKKAVADKNKQREDVIKLLRQLATYVEANFKDEPATLTSSGFEAAPPRSSHQTLSPGIRSINQGISGQLLIRLAAIVGAASYELRYAQITSGMLGVWTVLPLASVKKAVTIASLIPGTTYAFQVRSLGNTGFSDWSDSIMRMCI